MKKSLTKDIPSKSVNVILLKEIINKKIRISSRMVLSKLRNDANKHKDSFFTLMDRISIIGFEDV